jgi:hypothetical protein
MITKSERNWIIGFGGLILLFTSLPYVWGYVAAGEAWRFTGFVFGVEDGNSYIAKMLMGSSGAWLFRTPYTAYPQGGVIAFLPYLLTGKLAAAPAVHEQLVALFHLFRMGASMLLVFATYRFTALFVKQIQWRRIATAVIIAGGGLGWLSLTGLGMMWGERLPLEFYSPESFGFLSVYGLPHLAASRALLLLGFCLYFAPEPLPKEPAIRWDAGGLWLLMGLFQPLTVLTGWALLGTHLALLFASGRWGSRHDSGRVYFFRSIGMILVPAPFILYNGIALLSDPVLRQWAQQNQILSPPLSDYLLAYGILLPLVWLSIRRAVKKPRPDRLLLVGWVLIFPLLAYFPHNMQRRLPDGIWVALVILAIMAAERWPENRQILARVFFVPTFLPAIILLAGGLISSSQPKLPLFRPAAEIAAFDALGEAAPKDAVVLASFQTSNALPAWAPVRTLTGHGPESANFEEVNARIDAFYEASAEFDQAAKLLRDFDISYVFYGPNERAISAKWDLGQLKECLEMFYRHKDYSIYAVQPACRTAFTGAAND